MKLKIPPALVAFAAGFLMWGVDQYVHPALAIFTVSEWIYRLIFGIAIMVGIAGIYQFMKHQTTVDPHRPDKAETLVTGGIYQFTRNPMYLALLIGLFGLGLKLGNIFSFIPIPLFVFYLNRFQIEPEEDALRVKFGSKFENYFSCVRRWV